MLIASPKEYRIARLLSRFFIWGKRRVSPTFATGGAENGR
jgi:hypothetical protein